MIQDIGQKTERPDKTNAVILVLSQITSNLDFTGNTDEQFVEWCCCLHFLCGNVTSVTGAYNHLSVPLFFAI